MPAAAAVLSQPPTLCAACTRVLSLPTGAGEFACECGVVHGVNISDDAEYRCFADEEGQEDKKRAENYTREDERNAPPPKTMRRIAQRRLGSSSRPMMNSINTTPISAKCRMDSTSVTSFKPQGPIRQPAIR